MPEETKDSRPAGDGSKFPLGQVVVSQGDHGIRAGTTIEPMRVTFTGWGFAAGSNPYQPAKLGHYSVVCTWFCYTDDFGDQVALPDQHTLTPVAGGATKGKDIPNLGTMGMTPQQMEAICGAPVEPREPDSKYPHTTRIHYRKGDYDLSCLFYEDKMFGTTFWRSDAKAAGQNDKLI